MAGDHDHRVDFALDQQGLRVPEILHSRHHVHAPRGIDPPGGQPRGLGPIEIENADGEPARHLRLKDAREQQAAGERDLLRGRSPRVTLLYNEQYLTAGNLISADVGRAVNAGSAAVAFELQRSRGVTQAAAEAAAEPVRVDARLLFNPAINYARGVGLVLVVGLLQIVAGLSTIYVVGRELRDSTAEEWLAAAGGSPVAAWVGKLAPYVLYDLVLMLVLVGGFVAWFHIPVRGNLGLLALGVVAFSLATKAIGVLLTVWLANLRKALGVGSMVFGTAVAFSGVTFPVIAMSTFAKVWGGFVPLTRFMLLLRDQVMVGAPLRISAAPILVLGGTALAAGLLALPRMGRVLRDSRLWGGE